MAFESVKKIGTKPAAAKGAGKERKVIDLPNVETLANLHAIMRVVKGAATAIESTLKTDVFDNEFMTSISETGKKPDSVNAKEGNALINIQFKKRATTSPLSLEELRGMATALKIELPDDATIEDAVEALAKKNIHVHKNVKTQKLYAIDPELSTDEKLMKKVEDVLKRNGLGHIIVVQDEVATYVVNDDLMSEVCEKRASDLVRPCAVIGFKPTLDVVDPAKLAKTLGEVLDIDLKVGGDDEKLAAEVVKQAQSRSKKAGRKVAALEK